MAADQETIYHATAAGEFTGRRRPDRIPLAGVLAARATGAVSRWIDGLPEEAIAANPPVAVVAAWIGGFDGASKPERERLLAVMEDATWQGVLPDGVSSLAFVAALTRAAIVFDDVGAALQAARRHSSLPARSARRSTGWRKLPSAKPCTCRRGWPRPRHHQRS